MNYKIVTEIQKNVTIFKKYMNSKNDQEFEKNIMS